MVMSYIDRHTPTKTKLFTVVENTHYCVHEYATVYMNMRLYNPMCSLFREC